MRRLSKSSWPTGYSMIELLTVIVIMMVLVSLALSGFRIFQHQLPIKSSATRLNEALATARTFAISRNSFFRVTLDLDNGNFWVDEIVDPAVNPTALPTTPKVIPTEGIDNNVIIEGVLDTGSTAVLTTGFQHFVFGPDGAADRDARIFFIMRGDDPAAEQNFYTVRLYSPTGHSQVFAKEKNVSVPEIVV